MAGSCLHAPFTCISMSTFPCRSSLLEMVSFRWQQQPGCEDFAHSLSEQKQSHNKHTENQLRGTVGLAAMHKAGKIGVPTWLSLLCCFFMSTLFHPLSELNGPNLFNSTSYRNLPRPLIIFIDLLLETFSPHAVRAGAIRTVNS